MQANQESIEKQRRLIDSWREPTLGGSPGAKRLSPVKQL